MTTIDLPPVATDADAELARRLERLAARRPSPSPNLPSTPSPVPTASIGTRAGAGAGAGGKRKRRHAAKRSLNSEALAAQTARVDTVSGATYTSRGYEQSLQSAIDAARAAGIAQVA